MWSEVGGSPLPLYKETQFPRCLVHYNSSDSLKMYSLFIGKGAENMSLRLIGLAPRLLWMGMVVFASVFLSMQAWSQEIATLTPREIVEKWLEVYPANLAQAAEMTTSTFREQASKEEWIALRGPFLKNLGMKYVRAKVVHEERVGNETHVMVHAHIVTLMGDQPQDELYILVQGSDGRWLIDQVEVYTESFNRVP